MPKKHQQTKSKKNERYFNIAKSSNTFRSLLNDYKRQSRSQAIKPESVQAILEMKKKQAEQKETDQEYLFNEMKENARLNEEMKSMFGVRNSTKPKAVIDSIQKKIKNMTKMQKEKLILKDNYDRSNKIKIVNQKIVLPLIFPRNKSITKQKQSHVGINSENNIKSKMEMDFGNDYSHKQNNNSKGNFDLPKVNMKLNRANQEEYLATLDLMRNEFNTISMSYEDYFEREKGKTQRTCEMIQILKKNIDN